jgi:DNA-directed RNA polymerase specialized sigma24 family protein
MIQNDAKRLTRVLVAHAIRRGATVEEAQDAAQEAICRLLQQEDMPQNLMAWLYTVVGRIVADFRNRRRVPKLSPDICADPTNEVLDRLWAQSLAEVVDGLPPPQRDVLVAVIAGESTHGFATRRNITLRSAEGHLRRARKVMRREARMS